MKYILVKFLKNLDKIPIFFNYLEYVFTVHYQNGIF